MSRRPERIVYTHPDAILFSRFFREGVFQQLRLFTTAMLANGAVYFASQEASQ